VLEPEVAWQISSILADNGARTPTFGARSQLVLPGRTAAVKTGTTQNYRDGWTVGYTPSLATAVWVGNDDDGKTMTSSAATAAAPVWNRFMREALDGKPNEEFAKPGSLAQTTLDRLSGKFPTDQSPADQRITEWLANWQIPQGDNRFDDVHVTANVNRETGKLASELTPPELVERRFYFRGRSERPTDPNWERPVQAWLASRGGGAPPTEVDDLYVSANVPSISVSAVFVEGRLHKQQEREAFVACALPHLAPRLMQVPSPIVPTLRGHLPPERAFHLVLRLSTILASVQPPKEVSWYPPPKQLRLLPHL
jgi:hypothetical protein